MAAAKKKTSLTTFAGRKPRRDGIFDGLEGIDRHGHQCREFSF